METANLAHNSKGEVVMAKPGQGRSSSPRAIDREGFPRGYYASISATESVAFITVLATRSVLSFHDAK